MELLIQKSDYAKYRINKGGLSISNKFKKFLSWRTSTGRNMMDIAKIDQRIRLGAKLLSNYKDVLIIGTKFDEKYSKKFAELMGFKFLSKFRCGMLSNPEYKGYLEPEIIFVTNTELLRNAISEAELVGLPVIGYCNTDSNLSCIDYIIPINTTSEKALAVAFWLIAKECLNKKITLEEFLE
ncbi:MAG: hypothetical protein B6U88_00485 [Candidatus Aenigmarchaeota archaeon ex4484_56]|nr:MAG: hypothetical protein B6U88_00485 [Candidatus Aenigmarchaeota archaeon ex4484_56]